MNISLIYLLLFILISCTEGEYCSLQLDSKSAVKYNARYKRAIIREKYRIWSDAIIPYYIVPSTFDQTQLDIIYHAMNVWMNNTCIVFQEWNFFERDFIVISGGPSQFCSAGVGNRGDSQTMYLGSQCFKKPGYIIHEFGHVLGLWHEHNRPDRNRYVNILWENIIPGQERLFLKKHRKEIQSFYNSYDYSSIMHYDLKAFSKNGKPTMQLKYNYTGPVGQREMPSENDYLQLRYLYGCQKFIPPCILPEEGSGGSGIEWVPVYIHGKYNNTINCTNIDTSTSTLIHSSLITPVHYISSSIYTNIPTTLTDMPLASIPSISTALRPTTLNNILVTYTSLTSTDIQVTPTAISTVVPAISTNIPTISTVVPAISTNIPTISTVVPAISTNIPAISTVVPAISTNIPTISTVVPAISTNIPAISTVVPAISTNIPTISTVVPAISTNIPAISTLVPAISTSILTISTVVPAISTNIPAISTNIPAISTNIPAISTNIPAISTSTNIPEISIAEISTGISLPSILVSSTSVTYPIESNSSTVYPSYTPLIRFPKDIDLSVISGEPIGLKLISYNDTQLHWMSCFPLRCKVTFCANDSTGYPQCPPALFNIIKIHQPLTHIYVGDIVVLRPHHNNKLIVSCGKGACRNYDYCINPLTKKCKRHHLKVLVKNKRNGQKLEHDDQLQLKFINLNDSYIRCNKNSNVCKRLPVYHQGGDFLLTIFKLLL